MKTGHNQEGIGLDQKKERIGKFFRARSPESLKDDGKLPGIVGHALHDAVDFGAKAIAETGSQASYQSCASNSSARAA